MGARKVDFERLAAAMRDYSFAYLLTVSDDYRVHTVTVEPVLRGHILDVGLIGGHTCKNFAHRSGTTLLWPPLEPGGYSLIVDGQAELTNSGQDTTELAIIPTRALLHRNTDPQSPAAAQGSLHDCIVFAEA